MPVPGDRASIALRHAKKRVLAVRRDPDRFMRAFSRTAVPAVLIDGERRYVDANRPARLLMRLPLNEFRTLRVDDLTPRDLEATLLDAWERLARTGCVDGSYELATPDGARVGVIYHAAAEVLDGQHLIVFAPSGWLPGELCDFEDPLASLPAPLTAREIELLELAADGLSGPAIAERLVLSPATVRTHFRNIYVKLSVGDRAAAVAAAMRLGFIA